ncbi:MAG: hypothetical protein ACPGJE_03560, partial [Wenzhouxiangellaceae bacterium]
MAKKRVLLQFRENGVNKFYKGFLIVQEPAGFNADLPRKIRQVPAAATTPSASGVAAAAGG